MIVSLCTVCKNRASHYRQTILKNIRDNEVNGNVEFLLLDYNSDDDLEEWVKANLGSYIESGLLSYYKTFDPQYFHRSHSRNMAFRLAKGNLICNVDADNYVGQGFADYLINEFSINNNVFLCAGGETDGIPYPDMGGRICVSKNDFNAVGGYDEDMCNYGYEDFDLISRLEMNQLNKKLIGDERYLTAIKHEMNDRIIEEFAYNNIKNTLIHYVSPSVSKLLLLFQDDTYVLGTLLVVSGNFPLNEVRPFMVNDLYGRIFLVEDCWNKGVVKTCGHGNWSLRSGKTEMICRLTYPAESGDYHLTANDGEFNFYKLSDPQLVEEAVLFYTKMDNRIKMKQNQDQRIIRPNKTAVGAGIVYKNFNYNHPIVL